jgi:hypothetical protein
MLPDHRLAALLDELAGQPYQWGKAGPTIDVQRIGAVIPASDALLADTFDPFTLLAQAARRRRFLATLPARIQAPIRLADAILAAHRDAEAERERLERTCPWCGCDPWDHDRD